MKKALFICLLLLPFISIGKESKTVSHKTQVDLCSFYEDIKNYNDDISNDNTDDENYKKTLEFIDLNGYKLDNIKTSESASTYQFFLFEMTNVYQILCKYAKKLDIDEIEYVDYLENYDDFNSYSEEALDFSKDIISGLKSTYSFSSASFLCDKTRYSYSSTDLYTIYTDFFGQVFLCQKNIYNNSYFAKDEELKLAYDYIKETTKYVEYTDLTSDDKNFEYSNAFWTVKNLDYLNGEGLDYSMKFIDLFPKMSSTKISEIFKNGWLNYKDATKFIDKIEAKDKSLFASGTIHSQMAANLKALSEKDLAIKYYIKSFQYGKNNWTNSFLKETITYMLDNGDKSKDLLEMINYFKSSVDKTNCEAIIEVKNMYTRYGDLSAAASLDSDYKNCLAAAEKEKKRQEKLRRKAERGGTNFAIGTYPIAFFGRDYGVSLEMIRSKYAIEAGYRGMNDNVEYYVKDVKFKFEGIDSGKYTYSGNRVFVNFKRFLPLKRTGGRAFTGFEASYATKKFDKVSATYSNSNNVFLGTYNFKPVQTQYDLAYIFGIRASRHGILIELFSGLGASYKKVTESSIYYNSSSYIVNDKLLTTRTSGALAFYAKFGYRFAFVF